MNRRTLCLGMAAAWAADGASGSEASNAVVQSLRQGGVVLALRHALAPGTFDPPEFQLGNCKTQRNLDDTGRAQASAIGRWFRMLGLLPEKVLSSPWCRCMETAERAFGREAVSAWVALSSPVGTQERAYRAHQASG